MEKAESDALKVMIFMIEGILPENYFSSNLRGKFLKNNKTMINPLHQLKPNT